MIFNLNYIMYIGYSFLVLFVIYIGIIMYKKYSYYIYGAKDKIILSEKSSKKNSKQNNINSKQNNINDIKKYFKIKSTEKTYEDIKFISNIPNYININTSINTNPNTNNTEIQNITNIFIETKQKFYDNFVNSNNENYFIDNLDNFYLFYKNNLNQSNDFKNNILLKFYNDDNSKYIYVYMDQNKMIKIIYNEEYDNICDMIEKNRGIFILNDESKNSYFAGYGYFSKSEITKENIKNIFFTNLKNFESNKNYKLFCEYKFIKIYFYVCCPIII